MAVIDACEGCGERFEAERSDARFCKPCGKARYRAAQWESARRTKRDLCPRCGAPKWKKSLLCKSCDQSQRQTGEKNHSWKGGRTRHADGYIAVNVGGKYVLEHRYVWEQAHGPIPSHVHIHHANGDKTDNRLENLVATDAKGHRHRQRMVDPYAERVRLLEERIRELEALLTSRD